MISGDYYQTIEGYFQRRLQDKEEVRDLTQEVFLKALKSDKGFDNIKNLSAWLMTIARNLLIDHYRSKKPEFADPELEVRSEEEDNIYASLEHCLATFLEELGKEEADLIRRVDFQGINQKAIAKGLGIPYATLRSQVQRARHKLRKRFADICFITTDSVGRPQDCIQKNSCDC